MNKAAAFGEQEEPYAAVFGDVSQAIGAGVGAVCPPGERRHAHRDWLTGHRSVEFEQSGEPRAEHGAARIERMAADPTRRFERGFLRQDVQHLRLFYPSCPPDLICQTLSGRFDADLADLRMAGLPLPSSACVELLSVRDDSAREFCET